MDQKYIIKIPEDEVEEEELAPVKDRAVAYLIDLLIFYLVIFQIFMAIYLPMTGIPIEDGNEMQEYLKENREALGKVMAGTFATLGIFYLYLVMCESAFGMTVGKKIMNIKLKKGNISYKKSLLRNITKVIPFLIIIDSIPLFINKERRYMDMLADTDIVKVEGLSVNWEEFK